MRSCIYCGKELAKGEKCTCRQSSAHRQTSDNTSDSSAEKAEKHSTHSSDTASQSNQKSNQSTGYSAYNDPDRTQYRTGYTHKDSRFKRAREKARAKRSAKQNSTNHRAWKSNSRGFFSDILSSLRSPVSAVQNPKPLSLIQMLLLWAIQGALIWLCMFFILTQTARGPFALLGNLLAFNGLNGYKIILYMLMSVVSGAVGGIIGFFLYSGVFYAINRFIFRDRMTSYTSFCQRLALTALPFSLIALLGTLMSIISVTTLIVLLVCGAAVFVILTYEALKTQWSSLSPDKVIYGVMLGFFVMTIAAGYVIRLS